MPQTAPQKPSALPQAVFHCRINASTSKTSLGPRMRPLAGALARPNQPPGPILLKKSPGASSTQTAILLKPIIPESGISSRISRHQNKAKMLPGSLKCLAAETVTRLGLQTRPSILFWAGRVRAQRMVNATRLRITL